MPYSRTFTNPEILAMAGYQLDPGHSDLDNEQPMAVRMQDGFNTRDLRCFLGDIRKAKADFYAGLRIALVASVSLGLLKEWAAVDAGAWHPTRHASEKADLLARTKVAIEQAEAITPAHVSGFVTAGEVLRIQESAQ